MIIILAFFILVLMLAVIVAVGYAAFKGHPKNFDREMYWTCFAAAGIGAGILFTVSHRMDQAGTLKFLVSEFLGYLALLLFAVSMGCGVSVFTYRRGTPRNHEREKA